MSVSAIEAKVQAFVKLYNSTVEAIQKQLTTKPPTSGASSSATGSLFGDHDLTSLLSRMRQTMYEPIAGLPAEMESPADVGLSTGAPASAGLSSQSSLEGQLTLDPAKFSAALLNNPDAAKQMLKQWSVGLGAMINTAAEPGGTLDTRVSGDATRDHAPQSAHRDDERNARRAPESAAADLRATRRRDLQEQQRRARGWPDRPNS